MTSIFDPEYWRSKGVEPIVINIDTRDENSVEAGLAQLDQAIRDAAAEIKKNAETSNSQASSDSASE